MVCINNKNYATMKKLFLLLMLAGFFATACSDNYIDELSNGNHTCANNEIIYTTKYGYPIELSVTTGYGGNIVAHTYENGYGKIIFDKMCRLYQVMPLKIVIRLQLLRFLIA